MIVYKILNIIMFSKIFRLNKTFRHSHCLKLTKIFFMGALISVLFLPKIVIAEDVTSTNFIIFGNSVNGGGTRSTSTNFILESTLGELATSSATSTNFSARPGFQNIEAEKKMTMSLSTNTIDLGTLDTSSVSSQSLTVTVTTNAASGYNVKLSQDGNLRSAGGNDIDEVSDGSVTAGAEEYGIRTSGSSGQFNSSDTAISGTPTIASKSAVASAEETTVTFRASINSATYTASYSHTVTFTATANF